MSHIGLGTAALGRPQYINIKSSTRPLDLPSFRKQGMLILDQAYAAGIRYIDTAPGYGMAEDMVVEWLLLNPEADIEIATKWGYTYIANFDPAATNHEVKDHSLAKLKEQWEISKQLLPQLSTYQIHSATLDSGVLDNVEVLDRLAQLKMESDLIIGLTSSGDRQKDIIDKAMQITYDGSQLFGAYQVTYNIFDQSVADIAADIASQGHRIIIKEALANGRVFKNDHFPHYYYAYQLLSELSRNYNVGVDAVALRFCMDHLRPYQVLSGASRSDHLSANLQALSIELNEDDLARLHELAVSPDEYWSERKKLSWN